MALLRTAAEASNITVNSTLNAGGLLPDTVSTHTMMRAMIDAEALARAQRHLVRYGANWVPFIAERAVRLVRGGRLGPRACSTSRVDR